MAACPAGYLCTPCDGPDCGGLLDPIEWSFLSGGMVVMFTACALAVGDFAYTFSNFHLTAEADSLRLLLGPAGDNNGVSPALVRSLK